MIAFFPLLPLCCCFCLTLKCVEQITRDKLIVPCVRNDRPLCTLTLTQLPAAYSVSLNGLSCQLDSPSEIFNIQPEVYQATVCQMVSEGFTSVLLQLCFSPLSHRRYGHALHDSLRVFHSYINNKLRGVNKNISHEPWSKVFFSIYSLQVEKLKSLLRLLISWPIFTSWQVSIRLCGFHQTQSQIRMKKKHRRVLRM